MNALGFNPLRGPRKSYRIISRSDEGRVPPLRVSQNLAPEFCREFCVTFNHILGNLRVNALMEAWVLLCA
jgi:hypothetical protein